MPPAKDKQLTLGVPLNGILTFRGRTLPGEWQCAVCTTRNPKDAAVSMYHHARDEFGFDGGVDAFLAMYLAGDVEFGSWHAWHAAWARAAPPDAPGGAGGARWLHFEALARDAPARAVAEVADALGELLPEPARRAGSAARDALVARVVAGSRFDAMRAHADAEHAALSARGARVPPATHLRRGAVGGWRDELSDAWSARFDAAFARHMAGTVLEGAYVYV